MIDVPDRGAEKFIATLRHSSVLASDLTYFDVLELAVKCGQETPDE